MKQDNSTATNEKYATIAQASDGSWHWIQFLAHGAMLISKERFATPGDAWEAAVNVASIEGIKTGLHDYVWDQIKMQWESEGAAMYVDGVSFWSCKNRFQRVGWLGRALHVGETQTVDFREWAVTQLAAATA